ncbi:unnamed protein product [Bemisia tabaci]|uniref:Inositol-pentakisphosphate 2-kinase n=1 Tax=Bemisia tabaci TaxID=7038 RepID=A0A9P0A404_BEMTA|nr:PREDICTED: uncharacterized protein LOC109029862 [Bemisia tabaci]XP_018896096.1 PREDICTED: uncharacterized protein LOC109029862 [Bemisia tabaci]CAH0383686.1 unnamed protein product [Bemisia tabaci]
MLDAVVGSSDSVTLHRLTLRGKKWKYRGEGNANLVIALPSDRLIIRMRKREKGAPVTAEEELAELKKMWREVVFCCKMMIPLLGRAYIQPPVPAYMDKSEIKELEEALVSQRPASRHHKGIKFSHVTIYPDYAFLPIFLSERNQAVTYPKLISENLHDNMAKPRSEYSRSTSFHDPVFDENKEAVKTLLKISSLYTLHFDSPNCDNLDFVENTNDSSQISSRSISINSRGGGSNASSIIHNTMKQDYSSSLDYPSPLSTFVKQGSRRIYCSQFSSKRSMDFSTYCVEVKPKQGWIPMIDRRFTKCAFCLNQYLKVFNGSVKMHSNYCPLDLFSGNRSRMKSAVKALLITPQNNLKIFKDGQLIYGDETKTDIIEILKSWLDSPVDFIEQDVDSHRLKEKFSCLIIDALTRDLTMNENCPKVIEDEDPTESKENIPERIPPNLIAAVKELLPKEACDWSAKDLPSNCILKRILDVQKLEKYGADAIYDIYRRSYENESDDYAYVRSIPAPTESRSSSKSFSFNPVQRYLLATTAKDCSILISFQRLHEPSKERIPSCHLLRDLDNEPHVFNVGVSDLDPKPVSCIEKHKKRDCDVISACLKLLSVSANS